MLHFGFMVEPCPSFLYQLDDDAANQAEHEEPNSSKTEAGIELTSFNMAEAAALTRNQWSRMFPDDPFFLPPDEAVEESHFRKDPNVNNL